MDAEAFLDLANAATKLNMFPYFETAHCLVTCMYLKDDLAHDGHLFSRKHPLACWVSCMFSIFGGAMFAAFLLGEPLLSAIKNADSLLVATLSWYVVFYMPYDVGYKLCKFMPIKLLLSALKEVIRCHKVHAGVQHAAKIYPNSYLIMVIVGTIKGNGSAFLKIVERSLRGVWTPSLSELMQMSFASKACLAAALVFVADQKTELFNTPHALVYFGVLLFLVYFRAAALLLGVSDPFVPLENVFCVLFLGGIWDAAQRLLAPPAKGEQGVKGGESARNAKAE